MPMVCCIHFCAWGICPPAAFISQLLMQVQTRFGTGRRCRRPERKWGSSVLLIPRSQQDDAHTNLAQEPSSGHLLTPYLTVVLNIPRRKWVDSAARLPNVYLPMDQFGCTWCKCWPHPVPPSQNSYSGMLDTPFFVPTRWARAFSDQRV